MTQPTVAFTVPVEGPTVTCTSEIERLSAALENEREANRWQRGHELERIRQLEVELALAQADVARLERESAALRARLAPPPSAPARKPARSWWPRIVHDH